MAPKRSRDRSRSKRAVHSRREHDERFKREDLDTSGRGSEETFAETLSREQLLEQNCELKKVLERRRNQLKEAMLQKKLAMKKKDEVAKELVALQKQRVIYEAWNAELAELPALRKTFEDAVEELKPYSGTSHEGSLLTQLHTLVEAAAEELKTLRRKEGTYKALLEEVSALRELKVTYEAAVQNLCTLQRQSATLDCAESTEELSALRNLRTTYEDAIRDLSTIQKLRTRTESMRTAEGFTAFQSPEAAALTHDQVLSILQEQQASPHSTGGERAPLRRMEAGGESIDEQRKQTDLSATDGDDLVLSQTQRANLEAKDSSHVRENKKTTMERKLMGKVLGDLNTTQYLERKRTDHENKQERDQSQHCSESEATTTEIHPTSVDLKAVDEQHEEKSFVRTEERAFKCLRAENDGLLKKKQHLQRRLHLANEQQKLLRLQSELTDKAERKVEKESATWARELFIKEAVIESLKAELLSKRAKGEANSNADNQCDEIGSMDDQEDRRLREELLALTKLLEEEATSRNFCQINIENT